MASQGPRFPTSATGNTNAAAGGTVAWSNPQNIEAADGAFATCNNGGASVASDDLIGTGFGFSVPPTATINGILAEVNYSASNSAAELVVQLIKGGALTGNNKATGAALPASPATVSYGGSTDLWGGTFSPADINASNFGVDAAYFLSSGVSQANIDFFRITVFYTTPAPTVTSCNPPSGPASGGTSVTITGANFFATPTSITFGGVAATNIVFNSATSVSCTAPAHGAGAVNVVVTNPDGQSGTGTNVYTYNPPPTFSSINPPNGPAAGGTSVTISGGSFVATPTVTFGGAAATNVTFSSASSITCTTPVHSPVTVDVVITNPDGQSVTGVKSYLYIGATSRFLSFG